MGIRAYLEAGDAVTAEREAHTLKGVAGNIGADRLQEVAKVVNTLIRVGADDNAASSELEQTLRGRRDHKIAERMGQTSSDMVPVALNLCGRELVRIFGWGVDGKNPEVPHLMHR